MSVFQLALDLGNESEFSVKKFLLSLIFLVSTASAADKPNLLFIFLDDFGWKDTSYMGSDFYETPNLDKLASEGMIFTNAYSAAANCAPARACLMTGQYTPRHKIFNVGTGPRGKAAHRKLLHIPGTDTLKPDTPTWAKSLQSAGYRTASMGKWHVSKDPLEFGFDVNVGGTHSGGPPKGYYPPHPKVPGLPDVSEDEYLTNTISSEADKFIRKNEDRPWALYLTHFAVHTPLIANKNLLAKYEGKTAGELHNHVAMATMIQSVDDGVGKLIATLKETGQTENTAVVFFSDNGGYGPATDMAPLKGYKGTYYEGGIRVPFFVKWPGRVQAGTTKDTPVIGVDMFPTFCEMLGAELPADHELDGRSLVPLFTGADETSFVDRPIYWHFPAYLQSYGGKKVSGEQRDYLFRSRPCGIVRQGKWKLHQYFEDGDLELYDLDADISESKNLAESDPEKTKELLGLMTEWRRKVNAPVPTEKNPKYDSKVEAKDQARISAK